MALAVGTRLGSFEITGTLGAGGMGEVYLARDSALKRDVAFKVLPATLAGDPDRVARFQREAELLATLTHPHIAAIHGLAEADGVRALVLELVPGETLADRVARGPVPVEETLGLARQLADALDYAHEHGVVHRDLKPANLKVTPDGQLKVLDFGLAKALEGPHPYSAEAAHSPTLTSPAMTQAGMLLGTAAYMSPEQARGKPVDKRADIWAFGCVLYELLTGTRAFEGETVSDTLAAVLRSEPDWTRLPPDTPASFTALLRHCLTRDPKARLRDIGDARRELAADAAGHGGMAAPPQATASRARRWLPWAVAATLGAALAGVVLQWAPWRASAPAPVQRLSVDLGVDAALVTNIGTAAVLSPDGQVLAFAARPLTGTQSHLYVRRLDQLAATQLPGTEGARGPFFSPDGAWIAFFADRSLKKVETRGGTPVLICEAPNERGGEWNSDGQIVLLPVIGGGAGLKRVPATGGVPESFIEPDAGSSQRWPQVLPGARGVLYTTQTPGVGGEIVVQPLPTGERRRLRRGSYARYVPSGHVVFIDDGALLAAAFDLDTLTLSSTPTRVLEGVQTAAASDGAQFHVSGNGTLVYLAGEASRNGAPLEWLDAGGAVQPLRAAAVDWRTPQFSPDGRQLAFEIVGSDSDIWVHDVSRDAASRLTEGGSNQWPAWTPDGQRIAFSTAVPDGPPNLFWKRIDGATTAQRLTQSPFLQDQPAWHPSGRFLAFRQATPPSTEIVILPVEGGEREGWRPGSPSVFAGSPGGKSQPAFSPDGHWLAYTSSESGRNEIHVRPFPGPGGRVVVSTDGGAFAQWSPRTNQLFYAERFAGAGAVMVVDYRVENGAFLPSRPRAWTSRQIQPRHNLRSFALHPTGTRIAAHVAPEGAAAATVSDRLVLVTNFFDELRRLAPPGR